jgi:hypothetical protein
MPKWNSKKTITGEDENKESELKFLNESRAVRDKQRVSLEIEDQWRHPPRGGNNPPAHAGAEQ